jgi:hypothetical protein
MTHWNQFDFQFLYKNPIIIIWDIKIRVLQRLGHMFRMEDFRPPKKILHAKLDKRQKLFILKLRYFYDVQTGIRTPEIER